MRNRELVYYLKNFIEVLNLKVEYTSNNTYRIKNHQEAIRGVYKLDELGLFQEDINRLKILTVVYTNQMESIVVNEKIKDIYQETIHELFLKTSGIIESAELFQSTERENMISVKLPDYKYLHDISKFTDKLDGAIQLALSADEVREDYQITGFDTGSMWFEICLKSSIAFSIIGSVVWSALVIKKKYYEIERMKINLKGLEANVEHINSVNLALDASVKALVEAEAMNIISEKKLPQDDPEYKERLIRSIKVFSNLITDGCEVHGKIEQQTSNNDLFPDFKSPELIVSKIKQIADGSTV